MLRSIGAALLLLAALDAGAQVCSVVTFGAGTDFAVGTAPDATAVGDFNGDGRLDLAVSNFVSNDVSILLATGVGQFGAATSFPTGGLVPDAVVVADFNEDGRLDLAVVNRNSGTVSILFGNGSGAFSAPASFPAGGGPIRIAVGDFNGDHHLDLAVANFSGASILLGNGAGAFGAPASFAAGLNPSFVVTADFNGDGRLDLAVANSGSNNVSILLGNGTGTFSSATNFAVGTLPVSIAAADLSGDGHVDLAVANQNSENVSVLLGTGTGAFAAAVNYRTGNAAPDVNPVFPNSVGIGDFNGDGRPDLAVSNYGTRNVSILTGAGGGVFAPAIHFPLTWPPHSVTVMNRDLVLTNINFDNVTLLLNACPIPTLSPMALLFLAAALLSIGIKWSIS